MVYQKGSSIKSNIPGKSSYISEEDWHKQSENAICHEREVSKLGTFIAIKSQTALNTDQNFPL